MSDARPEIAAGAPELTRAFESERPFLRRVAYAITGSLSEAEDCVQEAWLRLRQSDSADSIRDLHAWLTTAVSRLALDVLRSARVRREQYPGDWLPEPLVEDHDLDASARVDESVSVALLVLLERLTAAERAAFLLHDVFGLAFEEIAGVLKRSVPAVRQLAVRARAHLEGGRPRFPPSRQEQQALLGAFMAACQSGDLEAVTSFLAPDVVLRSDGGGKVKATRGAIHGAAKVAQGLIGLARRPPRRLRIATVNGAPGLVLRDWEGVLTVVAVTIDGGRLATIDVMRNPEKLKGVRER